MPFNFPTVALNSDRHEKKKKIFKSLGENNFPPIILNLARGSSKHEINIFRYEKFLER